MQEITLPDGSVVEFGDDMSQAAMLGVIQRHSTAGGILHSIMNPQILEKYRKPMGEIASDIIPGIAHKRSLERIQDSAEGMEDRTIFGKATSAADIALEGAGLAADVVPFAKGAAALAGTLGPLMMRRGGDVTGMAKLLKKQQGKIGSNIDLVDEAKSYNLLKDSDGGRVLNTDTARELFPEYIADRSRSADVHERASAIVKRRYAEKLKEAVPQGDSNTVLFTAGGTGAGKSSSLDALQLTSKPHIIYDTNMGSFDSAKLKIDQALEAGKEVNVVLVNRDPLEALVNGALPRAERQAKKFGTGRTVPIAEHLKTHAGSRKTVKALAAEFDGDPRVTISVIDNNHGAGNAKLSTIDKVEEINDNEMMNKLNEALRNEYEKGNISEKTFKGFAGKER